MTPVEHNDPINAKILAISEDKIEGFVREPFEEIARRSGVPVETSKGEWGPGQQEIGLRYADALEMADRHVLYKHAAKEIAWKHGCAVTFMAKWDERYAGSSCHIHMSLWDADRRKFAIGDAVAGDHHRVHPLIAHLAKDPERTFFGDAAGSSLNRQASFNPVSARGPAGHCGG